MTGHWADRCIRNQRAGAVTALFHGSFHHLLSRSHGTRIGTLCRCAGTAAAGIATFPPRMGRGRRGSSCRHSILLLPLAGMSSSAVACSLCLVMVTAGRMRPVAAATAPSTVTAANALIARSTSATTRAIVFLSNSSRAGGRGAPAVTTTPPAPAIGIAQPALMFLNEGSRCRRVWAGLRRPPPLSPPLLVVLAGAHDPALRTPTENMLAILEANLCAMTFRLADAYVHVGLPRPRYASLSADLHAAHVEMTLKKRRSERFIKTTKRISFKQSQHITSRGRYRQQLGYTAAVLSCTDLISHHFPVQQGTITISPGPERSLPLIIAERIIF